MKTIRETVDYPVVRDSVTRSVWNPVWRSARDSIPKSVWDFVLDSVVNSVDDSVRNFVWDYVKQTSKEFVNENNF